MPIFHHHHHHGGILNAIEDEIEQLALSSGQGNQGTDQRQQTTGIMQDPGVTSYGQGVYGNYGPGPGTVPYSQASQYGPPVSYGQQGYDANASGTTFGGVNEGAPGSYQQPNYQSGYPPQQSYGQYPQAPPRQQAYPQNSPQPGYGPPTYGQGLPPQGQYGGPPGIQQNTQYPKYPPQGPTGPQQYQTAPEGALPQGPAPFQPHQYPAQGPPSMQSNSYAVQQCGGQQYFQNQAGPGASPYPPMNQSPSQYPPGPPSSQYPPTGRTNFQYPPTGQAPFQYPSTGPASQFPPAAQPPSQFGAPPSTQPQYGGSQDLRGQGTPGIGAGGLAAGAAAVGAAALAYGTYEHHQNSNAPVVDHPVPNSLTPSQVEVQFEPLHGELKHMSHHHAMHLLSKAHHSEPNISQIIGTYLMAKVADGSPMYGTPASRPEVKQYYHEMDKLEKLSKDFMEHHSSRAHEWKQALGPHRRYVFAQLYNRNELVRAFCQEMKGGPLALPALDAYSLGERISTHHFFERSAVRQANKNAALSLLARVRTVLLLDDSYSMHERGHSTWGLTQSETRWQQTRDVIGGLAPLVASHNVHGIDIHYLNRVAFQSGVKNQREALASFDRDRPNNGTPTGARINDILDAYLSVLRYYRELLPLNLIIITDGEANDEELLHQAIEHHVTEIVHRGFPAHQFGIEFVQVGDCEYAAKHLEKLEKEVSRHHHKFQRDVVGVTPIHRQTRMNADELLAIAVSGIDARLNGYMRDHGVNV